MSAEFDWVPARAAAGASNGPVLTDGRGASNGSIITALSEQTAAEREAASAEHKRVIQVPTYLPTYPLTLLL